MWVLSDDDIFCFDKIVKESWSIFVGWEGLGVEDGLLFVVRFSFVDIKE